ncbi:MAG: hypothetical protein QOE92_260 [Chloroflexota bacterium]|nr:hypothetical protein [Chloroflexota bacterium]
MLFAGAPGAASAQASPEECSTLAYPYAPPEALLLGGGELRVFAMHHKQCLQDVATYATIHDAFDREMRFHVDPHRSDDHPNLVVFNELTGLMFGVEGSRGQSAREDADQVIADDQLIGQGGAEAIARVAAGYAGPVAYYDSPARFGPTTGAPATVQRLFTAITDTMVRAAVEQFSALAREHGAYIVITAPLPVLEHQACAGDYAGWVACPGWHRSADPVDRCALGDPDLGGGPFPLTCTVPYVYVADTPDIDNVAMFFAPDGTLYDMQPKVNMVAEEEDVLGWHEGSPSTIHAIGLHGDDAARLPQVRMGVGISLDAFEHAVGDEACPPDSAVNDGPGVDDYPWFMHCLDSKGVNVFLQPEFNSASRDCMGWADYSEGGCAPGSWQPVGWMHSAWFAVQGRNPDGGYVHQNFRYAVNPFLVGNLFDIAGDGQSAIFARDDPRAFTGCYAGNCATGIYDDPTLGFTSHPDAAFLAPWQGPKPGFLALTAWTMTPADASWPYRARAGQVAGSKDSLQACEKGLAPGSGVLSGDCSENNERPSALVADLRLPAAAAPTAAGLPGTGAAPGPAPLGVALVLCALAAVAPRRLRRTARGGEAA